MLPHDVTAFIWMVTLKGFIQRLNIIQDNTDHMELQLNSLDTNGWTLGFLSTAENQRRFFKVENLLNDMIAGARDTRGRSPRTAAFYDERFEPLHRKQHWGFFYKHSK